LKKLKKKMSFDQIFVLGDIHGDLEVWLQFLKAVGADVQKPDSGSAADLVSWGSLTNTALVVCGDIIDRCRTDNQNMRLVYSFHHKTLVGMNGTDGEQPFEEVIILKTMAKLYRTQHLANNKMVCVVGNHDAIFLAHKATMPQCTTHMAVSMEKLNLPELSDLQLKEFQEELRNLKMPEEIDIIDPTPDGHHTRPALAQAFAEASEFLFPFWGVGSYIMSHSGFTNAKAEAWEGLGITDATGFLQALAENDFPTEDDLLPFLRPGVDPEVVLQNFIRSIPQDGSNRQSTLFLWSRPTISFLEELEQPVSCENMQRLGLSSSSCSELSPNLTRNVIGHNCGAHGKFEYLSHVFMIDRCASRAMVFESCPNGPVMILRIEDPYKDPTVLFLPPVGGSTIPKNPNRFGNLLLKESHGFIVLADMDPHTGSFIRRPLAI
jgi:hypothetical protein